MHTHLWPKEGVDRSGDQSILISVNNTVLLPITDLEELLADLPKCCCEGCRPDETQGAGWEIRRGRRRAGLGRSTGGGRGEYSGIGRRPLLAVHLRSEVNNSLIISNNSDFFFTKFRIFGKFLIWFRKFD